jgi:hypothetical protein
VPLAKRSTSKTAKSAIIQQSVEQKTGGVIACRQASSGILESKRIGLKQTTQQSNQSGGNHPWISQPATHTLVCQDCSPLQHRHLPKLQHLFWCPEINLQYKTDVSLALSDETARPLAGFAHTHLYQRMTTWINPCQAALNSH